MGSIARGDDALHGRERILLEELVVSVSGLDASWLFARRPRNVQPVAI